MVKDDSFKGFARIPARITAQILGSPPPKKVIIRSLHVFYPGNLDLLHSTLFTSGSVPPPFTARSPASDPHGRLPARRGEEEGVWFL